MNDQTPNPLDDDILDVTLSESLQTRWPARTLPERQIQSILTNIETQNRKFTMQTRLSNILRPVAFVGGLALLVLTLSWIFGSMRPNPAVEVPPTPTPIPAEATPLPAENPDPNATPTPTPAGETLPDEGLTSISYTVKVGDTCASIASAYKISLETLIQVNSLDSQCTIAVQQVLFIPPPALEAPPTNGFAVMPNVTFAFANSFPTSPSQLILYQQYPQGELTEDSVRAMAAQMGVNGEVTSYPGEGGDTIYNVTDGTLDMIFYGFPDQFTYAPSVRATPTLADPLPFDQRVAIAEDFLNAHGLLDYSYRAEPSATDANGVRFVELLDGIPLLYGVGKNPGLIERINISINPDGQVSSLFHSHHHYQPLDAYPLLTAEQAWASLAAARTASRAQYAVLAPTLSWTRAGLPPTEALTGYLSNENGDTTFYADDGRSLFLLDIPADMPLYPTLEIKGTVTESGLDWSSIKMMDYGYGFALSCGGGGGGGANYVPDANFGGGNFASASLDPLDLPVPSVIDNPLQPGDVIDGAQGTLYVTHYRSADGTETNHYNFWQMGDETNPGWSAILEGEVLASAESFHNLPIKIWGTVTAVDENGQPFIVIDRYEEAYPGTRIQAWFVTQQSVTVEGKEVILLIAQDGSQFVSNQSITWGPEGSLVGNGGDMVIVEGYIIPDTNYGGYPILNELMTSMTNGETSLDGYIIQSTQPGVMEETESVDPASVLTGHVTIENIELMYAAVTLTRCTADFVNNPEYTHFLYAQPVWRFTGHFDDGRLFEVQIQALPDEYLR